MKPSSDQELSEFKLLVRNYRGAIKKLDKSRGFNERMYWTKAARHWEGLLDQFLSSKEPAKPNIRALVDDYKANLKILLKEMPKQIIDDLDYRFDAIVDTIIADQSLALTLKDENSKTIQR